MGTELAVTAEIQGLLEQRAPVAIGVSGGKDSFAAAISVKHWLEVRNYGGPVILVHSDLGSVEWKDSGPACERLAAGLELPLHVVRREAGGMMERWEKRWHNNCVRYRELSCVKLILPWSTPSMRFCTSELKSAPIASFLKKKFDGQRVISVTGIRGEESANRAKMPVSKANPRLPDGSRDWNPLLHWKVEDVWATIKKQGIPAHEAYSLFDSSRVSCAFCIMSSGNDLRAALRDERNYQIFRRMCKLELESAFAFQGERWLSSLSEILASDLKLAQMKAQHRRTLEKAIPKELEYVKGWPTFVPDDKQAAIIAECREQVLALYGMPASYHSVGSVQERYRQLLEEKAEKAARLI